MKIKNKILAGGSCTFNFLIMFGRLFFLTLKIGTFCSSYHHFCFILKGVAGNGETVLYFLFFTVVVDLELEPMQIRPCTVNFFCFTLFCSALAEAVGSSAHRT